MTVVIHDPSELRARCDEARAKGRVGVIPTMGALHAGHLALVDRAREQGASFRVVTVFVNPLQFGEGDDLDRYPRTLDEDVRVCAERGVDLVFAPSASAMYPAGFQTHVEVETITLPLEGGHRPGHFRGVTTVVTKLFNLVGPSCAVFGRKDYQQWRIIERMVRDLDMPIEVIGHPIVREHDGLALSSRNRYLSAEQRTRALAISRGLGRAAAAWEAGKRSTRDLHDLVSREVEAAFDSLDYVAAVNPDTLEPRTNDTEAVTLLVAAHLGTTRLIDNLELS